MKEGRLVATRRREVRHQVGAPFRGVLAYVTLRLEGR